MLIIIIIIIDDYDDDNYKGWSGETVATSGVETFRTKTRKLSSCDLNFIFCESMNHSLFLKYYDTI